MNGASTPVLLCKRVHGDAPGATGSKLLQPDETWYDACPPEDTDGSRQVYLAPRGATTCTNATRAYPWIFAHGVDGDWHGLVERNTEFNGSYADVGYGIEFECAKNVGVLKCTVTNGTATCSSYLPDDCGYAPDQTALRLDIFDVLA